LKTKLQKAPTAVTGAEPIKFRKGRPTLGGGGRTSAGGSQGRRKGSSGFLKSEELGRHLRGNWRRGLQRVRIAVAYHREKEKKSAGNPSVQKTPKRVRERRRGPIQENLSSNELALGAEGGEAYGESPVIIAGRKRSEKKQNVVEKDRDCKGVSKNGDGMKEVQG